MKQLSVLICAMLLASCVGLKPMQTELKYQKGDVVYIGNDKYIIQMYTSVSDRYVVREMRCKTTHCYYTVLESEITKERSNRVPFTLMPFYQE